MENDEKVVDDAPVTDLDLTEEAKAQIRAEEIFREEIRREQTGRFRRLNEPFVIWFFSAIVIGLISFAYSKYSEHSSRRQLDHQKATDIRLEINFRLRQVDKLLLDAQEACDEVTQLSDEELVAIISNGQLSVHGKKLQRLYQSAPQLKVVAELGGIGSVPRTDTNANVWIGGSGWSNSHLPHGRGFRSDKFKYFSLQDLWADYWQVTSGEPPKKEEISKVREIFAKFNDATEPNQTVSKLPGISSNALTMKEWSERSNAEVIKTTTENVVKWVNSVSAAWENIKNRLSEPRE